MSKLEWHESAEALTGFARALQFCFRRKWSQQRENHFLESVCAAAGFFPCVCLCVCWFLNLVFLLFIMVYICWPNWLLSGESCSCLICGVWQETAADECKHVSLTDEALHSQTLWFSSHYKHIQCNAFLFSSTLFYSELALVFVFIQSCCFLFQFDRNHLYNKSPVIQTPYSYFIININMKMFCNVMIWYIIACYVFSNIICHHWFHFSGTMLNIIAFI